MRMRCIAVLVLTVAAAFSSLFFQPSQAAAEEAVGEVHSNEESVYYPAGWRVYSVPGGRPDTKVSLVLYYRYNFFRAGRPVGEPGWASIAIRKWNCDDCLNGGTPAGLGDYVYDKYCAAPKCTDSVCPVHSGGGIPHVRNADSCRSTTSRPKLTGGACGRHYDREKVGDTYYYYFDVAAVAPAEGFAAGEALKRVSVIFMKEGLVYTADLVCPEAEYGKYRQALVFMATNMRVRKSRPRRAAIKRVLGVV